MVPSFSLLQVLCSGQTCCLHFVSACLPLPVSAISLPANCSSSVHSCMSFGFQFRCFLLRKISWLYKINIKNLTGPSIAAVKMLLGCLHPLSECLGASTESSTVEPVFSQCAPWEADHVAPAFTGGTCIKFQSLGFGPAWPWLL